MMKRAILFLPQQAGSFELRTSTFLRTRAEVSARSRDFLTTRLPSPPSFDRAPPPSD
jgi:hypothetical protein